MSVQRLTIATRRSRLALWQAEHVRAELGRIHPGLAVELLPMSTRGDEVLDRSLEQIGGKGLFVKELETAMTEGRADLAVHSMKDLPAELPEGFVLAAICAREDPRDALVSRRFASLARAVETTAERGAGATIRRRRRHPGGTRRQGTRRGGKARSRT